MLEKISESKMLKYKVKKGLSPFGQRIVEIGKQAAQEAIAKPFLFVIPGFSLSSQAPIGARVRGA